jgi:nitrate reductase gamma subunit
VNPRGAGAVAAAPWAASAAAGAALRKETRLSFGCRLLLIVGLFKFFWRRVCKARFRVRANRR